MTGQDERAEMLAFKRDMPQSIVESGTAPLSRPIEGPSEPIRPLQAWDVFDQNGRKVDRVYFDPAMTALQVAQEVEKNIRSLRIGRLDRAGVERCQCGNPYTIRQDDALYCASCHPDNEPCLCGDKTARGCRLECNL